MSKGRQTRDGAEVRRVQVMLDDETIERAKALGSGNLSQGIREAVRGAIMATKIDMKKHEIEAVCQIAEATHDYNRGVLWMLGHYRLALAHESACKWMEMLVAERDLLIPEGASPLDPLPPEAEKKQQEIDRERAHRDATWAPIQAIIDEARRLRDEADPMGMGQAV